MSTRRGAAALPAVALLLAWAPAVATAQEGGASVPAAQARELAAAAREDPDARQELARIGSVDGRPVAMGAIVEGARPDEIAARVELAIESAAASGRPAGAAPAGRERDQAREVLADRRYTGTDLPRPLAGVLRWLARRLDPVARWLRDLADALPGGSFVGWTIIGGVVVVLAAVLSRLAIRRGAGRSGAGGRAPRAARPEDPAALERAADAAERDGDWEAAVRLRFRAGLLRLDARELIAYRPSLTTGEVARALRSEDFDRLGDDFDAIAYGGRPAAPEDAEQAREGWRTVLAGAPRR